MDEVPRVLGDRYEVGELLGRGGMAEVHAGRDLRLERRVAIKVLRSELARDSVFLARFRREAQSTALLSHPGIVTVYDTGEDVADSTGLGSVRTPYIVMEHVEGRTVRDLLDEAGGSGLGTQRAVEITAGVLTALQAAHDAGIVHRDVKPANVMVTPTGATKVMDFGIARAVADSSATMTQTSAVIGTGQYLSPEQARGEVVDARTDLYSTGCLLYELLTGRPPFIGDSPFAVAYQHVQERPSAPSQHEPTVDSHLDRVVLTALAKQREDRWDDADAFREVLLGGDAAEAPGALPPSAAGLEATGLLPVQRDRRRRRAALGLAVAVLALVVALGGWLPQRGAQEATGPTADRPTGERTATSAPVALTVSAGPSTAAVPEASASGQLRVAAEPAAAAPTAAAPSQDAAAAAATAAAASVSAPAQSSSSALNGSSGEEPTAGGQGVAATGGSSRAADGPAPSPTADRNTARPTEGQGSGREAGADTEPQPAQQPAPPSPQAPATGAEQSGSRGQGQGPGRGGEQQGQGQNQGQGQDQSPNQGQGQGGGRGQHG